MKTIATLFTIFAATLATVSAQGGKWRCSTSVQKIDDSLVHTAILDAEKPLFLHYDRERPSLIVRIKDRTLSAYLTIDAYVTDDTNVRLRKDANPPVTQKWDTSTDNRAIFSPTPRGFVATLLTTDRLIVQVEPYRESPVTIEFDTRGFREAAAALLTACNDIYPGALKEQPVAFAEKAPAPVVSRAPASKAQPTPRRFADPMNPTKPSALQRLAR